MSTAAVELLTGLPGAGKSLRMIRRILDEIAAGRNVYTCNIDGLKVKGCIPMEDPMQWQDLPAGSILFVDEAQEFFGARRSGDPRPEVKALSKVRHAGVTVCLVTQQPSYLDTYVRGLVGRHEHLLRKQGAEKSYVFRSNEVMDDPKSMRARVNADTETFRFDPELYKYYESAEIHTIKYRMGSRTKRGLAIAAVAVSLLVFGFTPLVGNVLAAKEAKKKPAAVALAQPASPSPASASLSKTKEPLTPEEYAKQLVPRIANQPWSAPIFDGRGVASQPNLICISSADSCTCMTEQATRYQVTIEACQFIARNGPAYNPYKAPEPSIATQASSLHIPATASPGELEVLHLAEQIAPGQRLGGSAHGDPRQVAVPGMGLVQGR